MKTFLTTCVSLALLTPALAGAEAKTPTIEEWPVPWENTRPRDPDVAPDGSIWFVGQRGDYVAKLNPDTGDISRLPLEDGAGPHNLIVDEDGSIWYAGNRAAHIGKINPDTGDIHKIPMPEERARDPHTLIFDDNGDIWFTVQGGNYIGKLEKASEKVTLIDVPTERARPYGIKEGEDAIWVVLFGSYKIARVDKNTLELKEIPLPDQDSRPRRLDISSDGNLWYGDYSRGKVGRYNPETGEFSEWDLPSGEASRPYAVAMDNRDRFWLVETGVEPNQFVGFDTQTETVIGSTPVPSGGGTIRHMVFDPDRNAIWFGADTNTVGRAALPE